MKHFVFILILPFLLCQLSLGQERSEKSIKIGLLLFDDPQKDSTDLSALHGAKLAAKLTDLSVEIVTRSCNGPWGVTSRQMVAFVYEDNVDAIITSVDGRNGHLAEQVATKTHKPLIAARATDPTLTQAYVPWFFRITPADNLQARLLRDEIFLKRKYQNITVIHPSSYNGTYSAQYFMEALDQEQKDQTMFITYDPLTNKFDSIVEKIRDKDPDAIIFLGKARYSSELIFRVRKALQVPLFGNLEVIEDLHKVPRDLEVPMPKAHISSDFIASFREEYNYSPGFVAAYAYDALNILVNAIRTEGKDPEKLQNGIAATDIWGATGRIQFDTLGNSTSGIVLGMIRDISPGSISNNEK